MLIQKTALISFFADTFGDTNKLNADGLGNTNLEVGNTNIFVVNTLENTNLEDGDTNEFCADTMGTKILQGEDSNKLSADGLGNTNLEFGDIIAYGVAVTYHKDGLFEGVCVCVCGSILQC